MTDAVKEKIKQLEEQRAKIAEEIYYLKESEKGYWIGIGDDDFTKEYYRLGWCTEKEAEERMQDKDFVYGFCVKEVTEEYNAKMYQAENMQIVVNVLDNKEFSKYKETRDAIKKDLEQLKEELDMCPCSFIF